MKFYFSLILLTLVNSGKISVLLSGNRRPSELNENTDLLGNVWSEGSATEVGLRQMFILGRMLTGQNVTLSGFVDEECVKSMQSMALGLFAEEEKEKLDPELEGIAIPPFLVENLFEKIKALDHLVVPKGHPLKQFNVMNESEEKNPGRVFRYCDLDKRVGLSGNFADIAERFVDLFGEQIENHSAVKIKELRTLKGLTAFLETFIANFQENTQIIPELLENDVLVREVYNTYSLIMNKVVYGREHDYSLLLTELLEFVLDRLESDSKEWNIVVVPLKYFHVFVYFLKDKLGVPIEPYLMPSSRIDFEVDKYRRVTVTLNENKALLYDTILGLKKSLSKHFASQKEIKAKCNLYTVSETKIFEFALMNGIVALVSAGIAWLVYTLKEPLKEPPKED